MAKKHGFTLAEVLISICIIGIIASITLPSLKSNIDKSTWAQGLKTTMSVINNGFTQMMAADEVDDIRETTLWYDYVKANVNKSTKQDTKDSIKNELNKFFKVDKMSDGVPVTVYNLQGGKSTGMDSTIRFYLANSSTINVEFLKPTFTSSCSKTFCSPAANIFIDVNGDKRPNTFGKDIFRFYLAENGRLYGYGSEAVYEYSSGFAKWQTACAGKDPKGDGYACTGRVIDEGFQINYK